jgi:hypothetical protein
VERRLSHQECRGDRWKAALPNARDLDFHHRDWIAFMMLGLDGADRGWDDGDGGPQGTVRCGT